LGVEMNVAKRMKRVLLCCYSRTLKTPRTFTFQGRRYRYFYHLYNRAYENSRVVEVPIVWEMVRQYRGRNILEVGNVLSHYFTITHDVLDKYEKAPGVINEDAASYQTVKKYDLIVSISTFEHIGWDENPREPTKVIHAIENLRNCLASNGRMVATVPLAYNPEMDRFFREKRIEFSARHFLRQISRGNIWAQATWDEVCNARREYPCAMAVVTFVSRETLLI